MRNGKVGLHGLGPTLTKLRKAADLKQCQLANFAGVYKEDLCAYEKGRRDPSLIQLSKLAEALRVPLWTIIKEWEESLPTISTPPTVPDKLGQTPLRSKAFPPVRPVLRDKSDHPGEGSR